MARRLARLGVFACGLTLALTLLPVDAAAQAAWVRGETKFNLRSGPGTRYRIVATVERDERVQITANESGWTQVRTASGDQGWLPARYVQRSLPDSLRLKQVQEELESARKELGERTEEFEKLSQESAALQQKEAAQGEQILELTEENLDLKAGERWPYLITGATILVAGVLAGAILARFSGRRPQPRIRF